MKGIIIKVISNNYTVLVNNKKIICKPRGIFRNKNITPLAGDYVLIDDNNIITDILDRKNKLNRPPVCNIDIALITMSTINPSYSTYLIDKLINIISFNNIEPVIIITKKDIYIDNNILDSINYYKKIGYKIYFNDEIDEIKRYLSNKKVILTGNSGVGKSSLLNKLDNNLNLKTNEISHALNRGKHTTRNIEFYLIDDFYIADTPGFSKIDFHEMTINNIKDNFIEFNKYQDKCKYRDCMHINEDDCYIKYLVNKNIISKDRYNNYIKFIKEKNNENISFNSKGKR